MSKKGWLQCHDGKWHWFNYEASDQSLCSYQFIDELLARRLQEFDDPEDDPVPMEACSVCAAEWHEEHPEHEGTKD